MTNPKGNRPAKMMYSKTAQHHLKTKRSRRAKRRKPAVAVAYASHARNFKKIIKNL